MIFVTVGTHEQPFDRLLKCIDKMVEDGIINEKVIIQKGYTDYEPTYCESYNLIGYDEMQKYIKEARIVITHGGPASFSAPLSIGKIPIVVPRQLKYNEHVNDHQLAFTNQVEKRMKNIIVVENEKEIKDFVVNYDIKIENLNNNLNSNNKKFVEKMEKEIEKIVYVTQPSPVVLISTISNDDITNVAPFAMFMNCSTKPAMIAIAISPKTDTYSNIKERKEFIIGIPQEGMLDKLYKAGEKVDKEISEFDFANLTAYPSKKLKSKRIKECIVNIDCLLENEIETGNHHIIVGKVVGCDIDKEKYSEDKVLLRNNIPKIYHMTGNKFMVNGELKEIS